MLSESQCLSAFAVFPALDRKLPYGFDPRLALGKKNDTKSVSFFFSSPARARKFDVYAPLRSAQSEVPRTSCAVSRLLRLTFPFSWCIRYKQKDDCTFLQPPSY